MPAIENGTTAVRLVFRGWAGKGRVHRSFGFGFCLDSYDSVD